jgi:uncharacterized DUF497 family protein
VTEKAAGVQFEWDEDKNEINIRKHGIDFADVHVMFASPMLVDLDERADYSNPTEVVKPLDRLPLPDGERASRLA